MKKSAAVSHDEETIEELTAIDHVLNKINYKNISTFDDLPKIVKDSKYFKFKEETIKNKLQIPNSIRDNEIPKQKMRERGGEELFCWKNQ